MDSLEALLSMQEELAQGGEINPSVLASAVKTSISLLGNAVAHFNLERRKAIMKHLNRNLLPLAKGVFPDRGPWLFGEGFGTKAKPMFDRKYSRLLWGLLLPAVAACQRSKDF